MFYSVLNSHKWTYWTSLVQAQKQVEYQNNINTKIAWNFKSLSIISSYWYITLDDLQMQYYIIHQIPFLALHIGAKVLQKSLNKKKYIQVKIRLDKSFKPIVNLTCLRTKNEDALVFPYCNQPNFFGKWDPVVTNCFSARKFKACTISQWGEQNSEKRFIYFMYFFQFSRWCM